jgi:hypothetical protein
LIATACLRRPPHKSFPLDGWHVTMALESLLADCILPRARRRPALGFRRAVLASSAVDGALRRHARQLRASYGRYAGEFGGVPFDAFVAAVDEGALGSATLSRADTATIFVEALSGGGFAEGLSPRAWREAALRIASANVPVDDATGGAGGGEGGYIVAGGFEPWQGRSSPGGSGFAFSAVAERLLVDRFGVVAGRLGGLAPSASAASIAGDSASRLASRSPSPEKASRNAPVVGAVIGSGNPGERHWASPLSSMPHYCIGGMTPAVAQNRAHANDAQDDGRRQLSLVDDLYTA